MTPGKLHVTPSEGNQAVSGGSVVKLMWIAGVVIVLDQVTKLIIVRTLELYGEVVVIPGLFSIVHYHNPGGAFGIFAEAHSSVRHFFFLFVSLLALGLVFYFYRSTPKTHRFLSAAFAMIFGGAVGNLVDRFRMGKVVDFLDVYVNGWHWPAFNIADSAITIGIAIFIFHLLFGKMPDVIVGKKPR